ncbi:hypothetical protein GH714_024777 [Hevea brasiliensis]|uniref:ABC-2 type transporter transmembrane domain-containing protein n=1 Tax=Hevea brasiliensis TaxID=3981 RepID=A0A6A6LMV7_HEVBR|nr:hypothetical protein GH714_024777 [Hevea brasiliensis]
MALMFGTMFWDLGSKKSKEQDIFNSAGLIYATVLFLGIQNASTVQPAVAVERTVFYRERAAGMHSALPYAHAQILVEIPYIFAQTVVYALITCAMIGFEWTAAKFFRGCLCVEMLLSGCPVSWTLYRLIASQFADIKDTLEGGQTVEQFVRDYYGTKHDFLGVVAAVIHGFTFLFAFTFAVFIRPFNFQTRLEGQKKYYASFS